MKRYPQQANGQEPSMLELAQAAATLGAGNQQAPGLDVNKIIQMQMASEARKSQIPDAAMPMLINTYGDNPEMMGKIFPQLAPQKPAVDPNAPPVGPELLKLMQSGGRKPVERRAVTGNQGPAEAIVDDTGNIMGFAQPNSEDLLKDYVPDAQSVGRWPSFKYGTADFFKNLFNFTKPQFSGQPTRKY